MEAKTTREANPLLEIGLFVALVAVPLVFTPFTASPFIDPKHWLLIGAALALVASKPDVDRKIALAAATFVVALVLTTALGVDPWWSLFGTEGRGMGLMALTACAVLLCVGTGLGEDLRERIPTWIFSTGVVVAAVAVLARFVHLGGGTWGIGSLTATIGHRVFVGGFFAAATVAATRVRRSPAVLAGLVVLGSGLSVTAVRSAWLGAALGLFVVLSRERKLRTVGWVLLPIAVTLAGWAAGNRYLPVKATGLEFSAAPRFTQLNEGSAQMRLPADKAYFRAYLHDPVIGSGLGTGWKGYLSYARPEEIRVASRSYADAHNLFLEFGTTTGTLGLLAFVVLMLVVLWRVRGAPKDRAWALGTALGLGFVQLLEPLNLVLTSLMFLTAGLAVRSRSPSDRIKLSRWMVVPLVFALLLASLDITASTFTYYGNTYDSRRALVWSRRLAPWRLFTSLLLAKERTYRYREGNRAAGVDARRFAIAAVRDHGWNPMVRLSAADVFFLVGDVNGARRLAYEDLTLFPHDALALVGAAQLALRAGDRPEAARLAREALAIEPKIESATKILREATSGAGH